ncbi:MAG: prepilin-type N-terminal cleavage/methylation domain-containing protein [Candidatus Omnitrophota bacterium]
MSRSRNNQGSGIRDQGSEKNCPLSPVPCPLKRGFTLIELLITTAIIGIIATAIFSTFSGGMNIYYRLRDYKALDQDVFISLEKMERSFRNALDCANIDFVGDKKKVSIPSLTVAVFSRGSEEDSRLTVGKVTYYLDTVKDTLMKESADYAGATSETGTGNSCESEMARVNDISFSYLYFDKEADKYNWKESWNLDKDKKDGKLPVAVKIGLTYKDDGKEVKTVRTVFLPLGQ